MTEGEKDILELLAEAFDKFIQLPVQHPMHQQEFMMKIHDLQRLILCRPTSRNEGLVHMGEDTPK